MEEKQRYVFFVQGDKEDNVLLDVIATFEQVTEYCKFIIEQFSFETVPTLMIYESYEKRTKHD